MKILFISIAVLLFYSCAANPPQQESVASTINRILMYAEQLESIVDYCGVK